MSLFNVGYNFFNLDLFPFESHLTIVQTEKFFNSNLMNINGIAIAILFCPDLMHPKVILKKIEKSFLCHVASKTSNNPLGADKFKFTYNVNF